MKYFIWALLLATLLFAASYLPFQELLTALADWSAQHRVLAVLVFSGLTVLAMVLLLPVSIQAMAAGFLFGLKLGFLVMWLAGLAGFVAAFLVGRGVARPWIRNWAERRPEFAAIDSAIGQRGLAVVMLARLSQILPYNMLNYAFGLTSVSVRDYALGSAAGMVPGILLFVFIGSTATDIASIMTGEMQLGDYEIYFAGLAVLSIATAVILVARAARGALEDRLVE